jgi:hypothetical protein
LKRKSFTHLSVVTKITLILLFIGVASSCKSKKKLDNSDEVMERSSALALKSISEMNTSFPYSTMRGKGRVRGTGISQGFKIEIRQEWGKIVWIDISANLMGIKVARLLASADSLHVINRLNKSYISSDIKYLRRYTGLADFQIFQALISGQLITTPPRKSKLMLYEGLWIMEFTFKDAKVEAAYEADTFFLVRQKIVQANGDHLTAMYQKKANGEMTDIRLFGNYEGDAVELNISIDTFDADSKPSFPFQIPSGYSKE